MSYYVGIDLHSDNSFIGIIDKKDCRILSKKVPNDLDTVLNTLKPFKIKIIEEKSYRARYWESFGKDPFKCIHCGEEMYLWTIYHPRYGIIYDESEVIERGRKQ